MSPRKGAVPSAPVARRERQRSGGSGLRGCQLRPRHPSWRCARAHAARVLVCACAVCRINASDPACESSLFLGKGSLYHSPLFRSEQCYSRCGASGCAPGVVNTRGGAENLQRPHLAAACARRACSASRRSAHCRRPCSPTAHRSPPIDHRLLRLIRVSWHRLGNGLFTQAT